MIRRSITSLTSLSTRAAYLRPNGSLRAVNSTLRASLSSSAASASRPRSTLIPRYPSLLSASSSSSRTHLSTSSRLPNTRKTSTLLSTRSHISGVSSSFHTSARTSQNGGPSYNRFGGKTSSGTWGNIAARFDAAKSNPFIIGVVVLGGVYYVYHLEKVPESGRWRFIDVTRDTERKTGLEAFQDILRQYNDRIVPPNHPASIYVQRIAQQILTSTGLGHVKGFADPSSSSSSSFELALPSSFGSTWGDGNGNGNGNGSGAGDVFDPDTKAPTSMKGAGREITENGEWEVFLINDDSTRNAFVLPGGKIFVFTGILPVAKTPDGLASVLGHEIAHQVARHGGERMSASKVLFALVILLEILGLDVGVSRLGLSLFLTLPNSRTQEAEADAIGLNLMAKACYDPREASQMWVRMSASEKGSSSEEGTSGGWGAWLKALFTQGAVGDVDFLSTHPASGKRVKAMEERLPEALAVRAASSSCSHELGGQFESFKRYSSRAGEGNGPF